MDRFVSLLPARVQPYVKALAPFVLNLAYAGATLVATGDYDAADVRVNVLGLVGAALTFWLPNRK